MSENEKNKRIKENEREWKRMSEDEWIRAGRMKEKERMR